MSKRLKLIGVLAVCCVVAGAEAQAQTHHETIVLAVTPTITQWAEVYKKQPELPDDPYFHIRVIERQKGWEVWRFNELSSHMAVTPKALEASRIKQTAKLQNYKDVEFRIAYDRWLNEPETRADVIVCDTDILSCIKQGVNAHDISFHNDLADCVSITPVETVMNTNGITLKTSLELQKSIGDCGCFSARAVYTSSVAINGAQEMLQRGVIVINKDTTQSLLLASEPGLAADRKIQVDLACAAPT